MIFGQPHKEHATSNLVEAALQRISYELDRVMWNVNQEQYSSPFSNTGNSFKCETFEVEAYSWNDEVEQPYNFKWRGVEISWYKYLGRGMSANMDIPPALVSEMLDACIKAAAAWEHSDEAKAIEALRHAEFEKRHAGLQS